MMRIQPARYITRLSDLNLSPSRFSSNFIYSSYLYSRQQWISHFRYRARAPPSFYGSFPCSSRSFSSSPPSSSSHSSMGLLRWYLGMLERKPILTKSLSASLIYTAADVTSQMITSESSGGSYDLVRTLRMAGFGLIFVGPSQHLWFNYVARILPKRDVASTLKKISMGQLIYGPCLNGTFFSYNASLQGENHKEIIARLKRDLLPTLANGLMFWPLCDFLTYKVIPVHLQPLVNSSFAYLWTIYLTYVASLKKAAVY